MDGAPSTGVPQEPPGQQPVPWNPLSGPPTGRAVVADVLSVLQFGRADKGFAQVKAKFEKKEKRRLQKLARKKARDEERQAAKDEALRIQKEEERERKREAKAEMLAKQQALAKEKQKKLKAV